MSITLEKIMKQSGILYNMKLEAGKKGIKNVVQWVHIIEDEEVCSFLHGNELVFSTGIACSGREWLMSIVKKLNEMKVSGLVINIGPYIKEIPKEVIKYCNDNDFPLYSVPWETRLVDITRDFCKRIVQSDQVEQDIVSVFKDIIFNNEDYSKYVYLLERRCFHAKGNYTFVIIYNVDENEDASTDSNLKFYIEKIANRISDLIVLFTYDKYRVVLLSDYTKEDIKNFISELDRQYLSSKPDKFIVGVSSTDVGIKSLNKGFNRSMETIKLAIRKNQKVMYYDDLGIYQLLVEESDYSVLRQFYNAILKPIENYDAETGNNYAETLKFYLENNGNVQVVANKMFVHRNTVNYQINKIRKITGLDLGELEVKLKFLLCYYIKDII
ncbi:MAG: PucR family transcriptional regulator [Clostridiales bacterium]|nr:PucR family transcriptional regulator [Clostridiales bacterium]